MADEIRDIGIFAAAGILVAVLIIGGFVAGGIRFPSLRLPSMVSDKGTLIVKITDAPAELKHLNITISNITAHRVEQGNETWEQLPFVDDVKEVTVDIMMLRFNVTKDLSITEIPLGNYTKLRLTITSANATYMDGETVNLKVPPGHMDVIIHFEIKAGQTTILLIDMQVNTIEISHSLNLKPVLKATVI
jgi:hypothetical protein